MDWLLLLLLCLILDVKCCSGFRSQVTKLIVNSVMSLSAVEGGTLKPKNQNHFGQTLKKSHSVQSGAFITRFHK